MARNIAICAQWHLRNHVKMHFIQHIYIIVRVLDISAAFLVIADVSFSGSVAQLGMKTWHSEATNSFHFISSYRIILRHIVISIVRPRITYKFRGVFFSGEMLYFQSSTWFCESLYSLAANFLVPSALWLTAYYRIEEPENCIHEIIILSAWKSYLKVAKCLLDDSSIFE